MGQAGIQDLLKVSQFTHRQNKRVQKGRIWECWGWTGPGRLWGNEALFMGEGQLLPFVTATTPSRKAAGSRGTFSIHHPAIPAANTPSTSGIARKILPGRKTHPDPSRRRINHSTSYLHLQ